MLFFKALPGSRTEQPPYHREVPCPISRKSVWVLWTNFASCAPVFPCSVSFQQFSKLISTNKLLLPKRQTGEAWNPYKKAALFVKLASCGSKSTLTRRKGLIFTSLNTTVLTQNSPTCRTSNPGCLHNHFTKLLKLCVFDLTHDSCFITGEHRIGFSTRNIHIYIYAGHSCTKHKLHASCKEAAWRTTNHFI